MKFIKLIVILCVLSMTSISLHSMKRNINESGLKISHERERKRFKSQQSEKSRGAQDDEIKRRKGKELYDAVGSGNVAAIRQLIREGADVNYQDPEEEKIPLAILKEQFSTFGKDIAVELLDLFLAAGARISDDVILGFLDKAFNEVIPILAKYSISSKELPLEAVLYTKLESPQLYLALIALGGRATTDKLAKSGFIGINHLPGGRILSRYSRGMSRIFTIWDMLQRVLIRFIDEVFEAVKEGNIQIVKWRYTYQSPVLEIPYLMSLIDQMYFNAGIGQNIPGNWMASNSLGNWVANIKEPGTGNTPLHYAVRNKDTAMVVYLLSIGADPSWQNMSGETPVHLAAGIPAMLWLLIRAGQKPSAT
jgi:hypothetical protein